MESELPIFVLGNPRSGTTLLRLLIASHPDFVIPPECGFAVWLRTQGWSWRPEYNDEPNEIDRFLVALNNCRKYETWNLPDKKVVEKIKLQRPQNYSELVACVYLAYASEYKPTARFWGDKNNFHMVHVNDIAEMFPQCRFVHIVRDVRDIACSYRELATLESSSPYRPNLPSNVESIAEQWNDNIEAVGKSFETIAANRRCFVRYEDLVINPEATLSKLCEFLAVPFSEEMLDFHRRNLEPDHTMDWKELTKKPVSKNQVGRFRKLLSPLEIEYFQKHCRQTLESYGYLDSNDTGI